jgi:hypothetical protein
VLGEERHTVGALEGEQTYTGDERCEAHPRKRPREQRGEDRSKKQRGDGQDGDPDRRREDRRRDELCAACADRTVGRRGRLFAQPVVMGARIREPSTSSASAPSRNASCAAARSSARAVAEARPTSPSASRTGATRSARSDTDSSLASIGQALHAGGSPRRLQRARPSPGSRPYRDRRSGAGPGRARAEAGLPAAPRFPRPPRR